MTDPDSGQPVVATLDQVSPGVHQALVDPATAARLPLAVHLAHEGQWAQVVQILRESTGDGDWLAMSEIIMCSEAWARFDPAEVEHLGHGSYLLSRSALRPRRGHNAARRFRRASYPPTMRRRSPPSCRSCGSPATATRRTRPANLTSIPSQQPNARIVVMPSQKHTVGHSGCGPQVIAEFIHAGTADDLDTACFEQAAVPGLTFMLP